MGVLSGLEPKAVFAFFEDLCALPHGSRHTRPVSDYMVAFAQQRGLKYRRDEVNNVIIWKDAAPGYEDAPAVMLQGHMDMLVEKGCVFAWYFHYMPVGNDAAPELLPNPEQREVVYRRIRDYRKRKPLFAMDFQNDAEFVVLPYQRKWRHGSLRVYSLF